MSRALSVWHGGFGRATLYQLNRPMAVHAHREGHLIFHVAGPEGIVTVSGAPHRLTSANGVAINPWEPHAFLPGDNHKGGVYLVLYIDPIWFLRSGGPTGRKQLHFATNGVPTGLRLLQAVDEVVTLLAESPAGRLFDQSIFNLATLSYERTLECEETERARQPARTPFIDFRVRKSLRLISDGIGAGIAFDDVARGSGLSRPHFYKLFRQDVGVTPRMFLNTLRMERALQALTTSDCSVTRIGLDLGFPCQSVFTRFFSSHVGMAPTDYRRAAQVVHA